MTASWNSPVLLMAAVFGLGVVCLACDGGNPEQASGSSGATEAAATNLAIVEYDVAGMTCGGCALAAEAAIGRLDGVADVEATYEDGAGYARVTYDPARVDPARIAAAIEELGYDPELRPDS